MTRTEIRAVAIAHDLAAARRTLHPDVAGRGFSPHAARGRRAGGASAAYYDGIAANYDRLYRDVLSQGENAWVRHRLRPMVGDGDRVLDLGCGTGLGYELLNGVNADYIGYEFSPAMIGVARRKFGGERRATFNLGDMANIAAYEGERFDAAISLFGSFSHALDPEKAVTSIRDV